MRGTRPLTRPELLQGHRRHRSLTSLEDGPDEGPPAAPEGLSPEVVLTWERLWSSPLACAWSRDTDLGALTRYVLNLNKWLSYEAMVARVPMVKGSKGQLRPNPLAARMDALEGQLRFTEEQYGLTPASRIRLGLEIVERRPSILDDFMAEWTREEEDDDEFPVPDGVVVVGADRRRPRVVNLDELVKEERDPRSLLRESGQRRNA